MFLTNVLFYLCCGHLIGVFVKSVSVLEEGSVTLSTGVTKIHEDDDVQWTFEDGHSLIAEISSEAKIFLTYDGPDGRFRDRLMLDNNTGSLTITNIRTEHAGNYEVKISGSKLTTKTFKVSVYAHLPLPAIDRDFSASFSKCSVLCSVVNVSAVSLSWYKGNSLLSSISVSDLSISLSLPLEVEYQDNNTYSCVVNNTISNQTTHLDIDTLCQPCPDEDLSLFFIVLICAAAAGLLLIGAVFCAYKKCRTTVNAVTTHEEDGNRSAWPKLKMKSKDPVYENVPKKR